MTLDKTRYRIQAFLNLILILKSGVCMSGALVSMGTGVPAGAHQNFKILGTAYRPDKKLWVPMVTG